MADISWPSTLPQFVFEQGYSEKLNDQVVESKMNVGPPKIRRRFTKQIRSFSLEMRLTQAEKAVFETFWQNTASGGSRPFDWVHPQNRTAITFRFRLPAPSFTSIGGADSIVRFAVETE